MTALTATLWERYEAQRRERIETGRPLQPGDLVHEPGIGLRPVYDAGNAGDCIESRVETQIRTHRCEKQEM
jgi:hypothetical protein